MTSSQNQHALLCPGRNLQQRRPLLLALLARIVAARHERAHIRVDRSGRAEARESARAGRVPARRGAESTSSGRPCTGGADSRRFLPCSRFPRSMPAYMTCTRSAIPATTPIEWVIMITPVSRSFCSDSHQVENLRLDRHVERGGWLVGNDQFRIAGKRHRDHHALAHTAGELVRILIDALFRVRDADHAQQLDRRALWPDLSTCPCEAAALR